ncbi:MAG: M20 aminoacylase family protein [Rhodobacterales bacterium]
MPVINSIADNFEEMAKWRQHIHANPELGFECHETAKFVVERLKEFGVDEISEGWAKTGVVAVINGKGEGGTIGLRADMDALPMPEMTGLEYASTVEGKMHACGHDGHTTMLLGAAKYLAETRNFSGRVVLIFQPAEEGGGGARVMCDEGLIEKYGITQVFGQHNMPDLPVGEFQTRAGPLMASVDDFEITIFGKGGHAARPNSTVDPIVAGAAMVQSLQTIVSRNIDPIECGVLTVTQFHGGTAFNIIPETVKLTGTLRSFTAEVKALMRNRLVEIMDNTAAAYGARAELTYRDGYPSTVNNAEKAEFAMKVAASIVGDDQVSLSAPPRMGAEDFSFMLEKCPGAYVFVGNGPSAALHHQEFNFNDEAAPIGASYLARIVEAAQPV